MIAISENKSSPIHLYHGSFIQNLKILDPNKGTSTHDFTGSKRIYAASTKQVAVAFTFSWTDDNGVRFGKWNNGPYTLEIPEKYLHILDNPCSMYTVDGKKFIKTEIGLPEEYYSSKHCEIFYEEKFTRVKDALQKYKCELKIHYGPIVLTDNRLAEEVKVVKIVTDIIDEYHDRIPIYTDKIIIKSHTVSHSHPILTLNTIWINFSNPKNRYLKLLIHENLHYFVLDYMKDKESKFLKDKYKDVYYDNKDLQSDMRNELKSFITHIVVIWNEINILRNLLGKKQADSSYGDSTIYKFIDTWVLDNFDKIEQDLKKLNLIWKKDFNHSLFEIIEKDDLDSVNEIISTFSYRDKKMMGPRVFYDPSEFRRIKYLKDIPVAYVEARIHNNRAKINIGSSSNYRQKGHIKQLLKDSLNELKKEGVHTILAAVDKENIPSNLLMKKFKFTRIINEAKLKYYKFYDSDHNYYELNIEEHMS